MTKYRSLCLLLLIFNLGVVTIFEAHAQSQTSAQTGDKVSRELEAAARQKIVVEATALVKGNQPAAAYALLQPYQSDYAGDPDYDYLLGLAALDSGKATEAIFALERVLAVNPGHLQARAEIARAYLATGETDTSEQEFNTVKEQNPPREVSDTIQKYLDIIATGRSGRSTSVQGYVEALYGNDSNVNSATASREIAIPAFGGTPATLSADGVANSDRYTSAAAGISIRHAVSDQWAIVGAASFNQRMNSSWDIFDTNSLDGSLGANLTKGDNNYSALVQLQSYEVDDKRYRNAQGMTAQWQSNLSNSSQASTYLQYTYLTYPGQDFRDADRYVVGTAYGRSLTGKFTPTFYVSAYGGTEQERADDRPHLGHNLYGLRIGGEMKVSAQTTLLASVSAENRKYGGPDPFLYPLFLVVREDKQTDLGLSLSHTLGQQWTITSSLNYTRNNSNIVITDYARTAFSIGVRRNFN